MMLVTGLSPPVRGKLDDLGYCEGLAGSIPARAGETVADTGCRPVSGVYPRPCGGNAAAAFSRGIDLGLSPHGRGKPRRRGPRSAPTRSIPARAGETCMGSSVSRRLGVYPRTGGGNLPRSYLHPLPHGLSPHGRGKPRLNIHQHALARSIPARAGETGGGPPPPPPGSGSIPARAGETAGLLSPNN